MKAQTKFDHPGTSCPCGECAGERARRERAAQGLGPTIQDPAFYTALATAVARADEAKGGAA